MGKWGRITPQITLILKFTATRTEMTYDAIVRFRYCSRKPVLEIISIFDGIYLKK